MAKPGTRIKSIVLQSFMEEPARRLACARQSQKLLASSEPEDEGLYLSPDAREDLLDTIRENVIPRLLQAHLPLERPQASDAPVVRALALPSTADVTHMVQISVRQDIPSAIHLVASMLERGLSLEIILLRLVAPAARELGDDWLADTKSFADVTLGLSTLHELVQMLSLELEGTGAAGDASDRGTVVLLGAHAEQHTLGLYIFGELLRRARWGVVIEPNMSHAELVDHVAVEHVDVVGISVSCTEHLESLARLIETVQESSTNTRLTVMLGGALDLTAFAQDVGVEFCSDAAEAVSWLDQHVDRRGRGRDR